MIDILEKLKISDGKSQHFENLRGVKNVVVNKKKKRKKSVTHLITIICYQIII